MKTWEEIAASNDRFRRLAVWSGVPTNTYRTHRLCNFVPRLGTEKAYRAALDFVSGKAKHHFLSFVGETGRGKTHLTLGIAWHWLENEKGLVKYYHQAEALLDALRAGFNAEGDLERKYTFGQLMHWLRTVDLLVVEDLGRENATEWAATKLDEIVDYRYVSEAKTVFTTNLSPDALSSRGEQRLASRLREGIVELLECDDYRLIKAREREGGERHLTLPRLKAEDSQV